MNLLKRLLNKQAIFNIVLQVLAFTARSKNFNRLTYWATNRLAILNIWINKPLPNTDTHALAKTWKDLMPADGQEFFKVKEVDSQTAIVEIHLHCPLRGTGDVNACYKLMNYDRTVMNKIGANLIVLESQSNSGNNYCTLAIRQKEVDTSDLIPAHDKK